MFTIILNESETTYNTINDVIKYLNSSLYYCDELYITSPIELDSLEYSELYESDIEDLFSDALHYTKDAKQVLTIVQTWN